MKSELVVFVVDADPGVCDSVIASLWQRQVTVHCFSSAEQFLDGFDPDQAGCLLVGMDQEELGGSQLQEHLGSEGVNLPMIVMGKNDEHGVTNAVRAMRGGAVDFLTKPLSDYGVWNSVKKAITRGRQDNQARLSK
jgi:FixJ family two-component response regulator